MAAHTALLIIDVQEGMFQIQPAIHCGEELLRVIGDLLKRARSAGVDVVHVQHDGAEPDHPLRPSGPGWAIHAAVAPRGGEAIIRKQHSDSFHGTALQELLVKRGIQRLVVAGIQTDYCVDTTCRRAFSLGYDVTLVSDAHTTWDNSACRAEQIIAHHNEVLGNGFASVKLSREVEFPGPS